MTSILDVQGPFLKFVFSYSLLYIYNIKIDFLKIFCFVDLHLFADQAHMYQEQDELKIFCFQVFEMQNLITN